MSFMEMMLQIYTSSSHIAVVNVVNNQTICMSFLALILSGIWCKALRLFCTIYVSVFLGDQVTMSFFLWITNTLSRENLRLLILAKVRGHIASSYQ